MPDEIREALPILYTMMGLMNLPLFRVPGVEADDVIATLAVRALGAGMSVEIASPDKVSARRRDRSGEPWARDADDFGGCL